MGVEATAPRESAGLTAIAMWYPESWSVVLDDNLIRFFGLHAPMPKNGMPINDFATRIHLSDRLQVVTRGDDALRNQLPFAFTYRLLDVAGRARHVHAEGFWVSNASTEAPFMMSLIREVDHLEPPITIAERLVDLAMEMRDHAVTLQANSLLCMAELMLLELERRHRTV